MTIGTRSSQRDLTLSDMAHGERMASRYWKVKGWGSVPSTQFCMERSRRGKICRSALGAGSPRCPLIAPRRACFLYSFASANGDPSNLTHPLLELFFFLAFLLPASLFP